jgi:REP-associated tyrosine transposase
VLRKSNAPSRARHAILRCRMTYYARNLPHWQPAGKDIFITWRLYGSLPAHFRTPRREDSAGERFRTYDRVLDLAGVGPLWLSDPRVAECMIASLKKAEMQEMFQLHAYVVMANHVHVLLEPKFPIARITRMVKGSTAREANCILGRTGKRFWQEESFDHWIRNAPEWGRVRTYVERNPVAAGLVRRPEEWPWSSAGESK